MSQYGPVKSRTNPPSLLHEYQTMGSVVAHQRRGKITAVFLYLHYL